MGASVVGPEEFAASWKAVFGDSDVQPRAMALVGEGVLSVDLLERVAALSGRSAARWEQTLNIRRLVRRLLLKVACDVAEIDPQQVGPWVTVVASGPGYREVRDDWQTTRSSRLRTWCAVPGGPWAWAAGLEPSEAADQPVEHVQAVAALRGFVVSPAGGALGA